MIGLAAYWFVAVAAAQDKSAVRVERDVPVPMRDGIVLRADVYRPVGEELAVRARPLGGVAPLGRQAFRYLIVVCSHSEKNCPTIWPGQTERLYWPFDDPAAATGTDEEIMAVFRRVRDEIDEKVRAWLAEREIPVQKPASA